MKSCQVARLLAYVTGLVIQELLLQVEYLIAENRILRAHAPVRLRLSNEERFTLADIGRRLGRKGLAKVAEVAHFHAERPHQGKGNVLRFPEPTDRASPANRVECRQRLGGLLRYYARAA